MTLSNKIQVRTLSTTVCGSLVATIDLLSCSTSFDRSGSMFAVVGL